MPKQIFDNDEELFDYGSIDELAAMGIGDRGYTDVNPPIGSDELFQDHFERRAREKNRDGGVPGTPSVAVLDPKTGAWTGLNQLGNEVEFAPQANNQQTVLRLDEWGMPAPWTLALGLDIPDSGLPAGGFEATALIFFGAGGITQYAEIDWAQGASITLPMNALNVVARYSFGIDEAGSATLPTNLRLRASICRYATTTGKATRTFSFNVANGNPLVVPIPPFAKNLSVYDMEQGAANPFTFYGGAFQVRFFCTENGSGGPVAVYDISQLVTYLNVAETIVGAPLPLPIPSRARFVAITNLAGTPITNNNLFAGFQFEIGL